MKRFLLSTLALCLAGTWSLSAQIGRDQDQIPLDPEVRKGVLENGMTYYIRHNEKPKGLADFYIYHDVGAVQETDNQQGLAHFLEHMAFNGTKNLPGKMLLDYLETIGVKFGQNINAFTGQESTCYMVTDVPLLREGIIDTALLVMHDWSHFIALEGEEIDKERGVIIEEYRQGQNASRRMWEATGPTLFNNTLYARRNVIGNEPLLRSFPHQDLRDFYLRWYRPDLQTVVIVGDIDVDQIEQKLKVLMADIPATKNPEKKVEIKIPGNKEPLIEVVTDVEQSHSVLVHYIKHEPRAYAERGKFYARKESMALNMAGSILNERLSEISKKPDAAFVEAGVSYSDLTTTSDVMYAYMMAREGEVERGYEVLYSEMERAHRHGFTQPELDRVKANMLSGAEKHYEQRNDRRNDSFIWSYISNFTDNEPYITAELSWELTRHYLTAITLKDVNDLVAKLLKTEDQIVIFKAPEKEGLTHPTEASLAAVITKVNNATIEPFTDGFVVRPLMSSKPKAGKVKKTTKDIYGATVWTLSNGAKVVAYPTDLKKDEIMMGSATGSRGGLATISQADYTSSRLIGSFSNYSGVADFSQSEIPKVLAGKQIWGGLSVSNYDHGFNGQSSRKDLETLLQYHYVSFMSPRFESDDFNVMMSQEIQGVQNAEKDPRTVFGRTQTKTLFNDNPRRKPMDVELLKEVDFAKLENSHRQLFSDGTEFTYYFVGDFDLAELKPLVETYIGSLPGTKKKQKAKNLSDDGVRIATGVIDNVFPQDMQVPKTTVCYVFSGDIEYSTATQVNMSALSQILDIRYTESIREEKGGTYGVSVGANVSRTPVPNYTLSMRFDTDPAMADELMEIIDLELENIAENGPKVEDVAKIKEFMVKQRADNLKKNGTWMGYITNHHFWGTDANLENEMAIINLNGAGIQALAKKIVSDKNRIRVIMTPKTAE